jgi:hypothetical protein
MVSLVFVELIDDPIFTILMGCRPYEASVAGSQRGAQFLHFGFAGDHCGVPSDMAA